MHSNYYLFRRQTDEIGPALTGATITKIFVLNKTDIVFELSRSVGNPLYFVVIMDVQTPAVLLERRIDQKAPRHYVFSILKNQSVRRLSVLPFDKQVILETELFTVEAVLYGKDFNLLIRDSGGKTVEAFRKIAVHPKQDRGKRLSGETLSGEQNMRADLTAYDGTPLPDPPRCEEREALAEYIRSRFAAVNRTLLDEILFRYEQKTGEITETAAAGYDKTAVMNNVLREILTEIARELRGGPVYLYFKQQTVFKISLIRLHHSEAQNGIRYQIYSTVNEAWIAFIYKRRFHRQFESLYSKCRQALEKRASQLQRALQKIEELADLEQRKREAEMKGNLLLTFKHTIPSGASQVELDNIFSEKPSKVTIKLNPAKSVSENAERYFNKFKDLRRMKAVQDIKKDTYRAELEEIRNLQEKLHNADRMPKLQAVYKECLRRNLIQDARFDAKRHDSSIYSFNRIRIENDWEVLIGKSGEQNDRLTFEIARKWDIWLHAQGVPGAHVILRLPDRNKKPPPRVIEQAAAIAAAHSKARHSGTVPVVYTEVRYVHRVRKAAPGTVTLRNEQVVFVTPLKLSG